ncbi:MAG: ArsC family reductase [Alphaproteobacteria bacterium]
MITIYGIKNCDTVKKALKWLDAHGIAYTFHNYKKQGADLDALTKAIEQHGWDKAINKRGTTWRNLSEEIKSTTNEQSALELGMENPSVIKRPLLMIGDMTYLGFSEEQYKTLFK